MPDLIVVKLASGSFAIFDREELESPRLASPLAIFDTREAAESKARESGLTESGKAREAFRRKLRG